MKKLLTILSFIGLIILGIIINITPMILIATQDRTPIPLRWGLSVGYLALVIIIINWLWNKYNKSVSATVLAQPFTWKDFGKAFLYYLPTRLIAILGTIVMQFLSGNSVTANDAALQTTNEQAQKMFVIYFIIFHITIGLFAPIYEELVYRGMFTTYFFKTKGMVVKLLVSSSIFSLVHLSVQSHPSEFIIYFALGAILYLAYARRGNIKDAMMVHFLNNFLLVLFSIISYIILMLG